MVAVGDGSIGRMDDEGGRERVWGHVWVVPDGMWLVFKGVWVLLGWCWVVCLWRVCCVVWCFVV